MTQQAEQGDREGAGGQHDEGHKERIDRELGELLQGLRVALPGVQVLFAFLLTVPFAAGFGKTDSTQRGLLFVTTVAAALSSICFIAPAAQHRVLFRTHSKETLLERSNRFMLVGTACLGVAIVAALALVLDFLFARAVAVAVVVVVGVLVTWSWYVQPALTRARAGR